MLTLFDAPWLEYLEIDEDTGERKLRDDTPQEIREKYEEYCQEQSKNIDEPRAKQFLVHLTQPQTNNKSVGKWDFDFSVVNHIVKGADNGTTGN